MRMDTETISYVLEGHELQNDVQTMIQVFLANRHYIRTDTVTDAEITVKSEMKEGIASAMLYRRGEKASAWSMEYDEKMLTEKEQKRIIKRTIYELLKAETGIRPQWGLLTGVRPAKLISSLLEEGKTDKECLVFLTEDYLVMPHKAALALKVAKAERKILEDNRPEEISLYIGIPFCPTRCLYCSFTAYPLHQYKNRVDEYLDAMFRELDWLAAYSRGFVMKNIYIGGGTPTSLNEAQLERLLQKVEELFHPDESMEYTVEAPRYDYKRKAAAFKGVRREPHFHQSADDERQNLACGRQKAYGGGYPSGVPRGKRGRTSEYQYGFDSGSAGRGCRRCPQYHGRNHEAGTR